MAEQTLNAADNPNLANNLITQAMTAEATTTEKAVVTPPSDNLVTLPGGYITATGEVLKTAEVRELTGRDEETIARNGNFGRSFSTILSCGVVKIGENKATEAALNELLSGDRDALMLGIYKATFGPTANILSYCQSCDAPREVEITIDEDIKVKSLADAVADRSFTVKGRNNEYLVTLPNGAVQKELTSNLDKSMAELTSILLQGTVMEVDGKPVLSKQQVLNFGITDRKAIATAISERNPGPQFEDVVIECPDCGGKVVVPVNLGTLFRF